MLRSNTSLLRQHMAWVVNFSRYRLHVKMNDFHLMYICVGYFRFTKNLSPNKISVKFLKGEGELHNLELDETTLSELLELPPWIRLTKAVCNRISAKASESVFFGFLLSWWILWFFELPLEKSSDSSGDVFEIMSCRKRLQSRIKRGLSPKTVWRILTFYPASILQPIKSYVIYFINHSCHTFH